MNSTKMLIGSAIVHKKKKLNLLGIFKLLIDYFYISVILICLSILKAG